MKCFPIQRESQNTSMQWNREAVPFYRIRIVDAIHCSALWGSKNYGRDEGSGMVVFIYWYVQCWVQCLDGTFYCQNYYLWDPYYFLHLTGRELLKGRTLAYCKHVVSSNSRIYLVTLGKRFLLNTRPSIKNAPELSSQQQHTGSSWVHLIPPHSSANSQLMIQFLIQVNNLYEDLFFS